MSREERLALRDEARDMFYHAYRAYMENAYPADELMPLSCAGRYRGLTPNRGDIDDSLGNFSLTLIDTLDTLVIIGDLEEFEHAIKLIIQDVSFDNDVIVSVFETNIRVLGGLLSAHILAEYLQSHADILHWYKGELLSMAKDVGFRLLPAFNTTTGIPYARVNLKFGVKSDRLESAKETCTACAGSIILEMAALSRLTGEPIFEEKAHRAMDELWKIRHRSSDLMGTVLNVHSGDWVRRDSGVGAGIDSYYEYCLKAYILLGDERYLDRFNRHYSAVMKYVWQGPLLLDVHMHRPHTNSRNYMDALLAFWPGLQVLKGDIKPAVETHEMLYQVMQRHKFIPEAFTTDFQIHWGNHPLRPEFLESTYFLYGATNDPYYLQVGKTVLQSLQKYTRVPCGYAAVNDVRTGKKEDRMDSFVLAETFKYLYLLFADRDDLIVNLDEFIFTTEGHLLPLSLGSGASRNKSNILDDEHAGFSSSDESEFARICPNTRQLFPESVREPLRNLVDGMCPRRIGKKRLTATEFSASNLGHLKMIRDMGINIVALNDGRVQLIHTFTAARSTADAEDGLLFMQEMVEMSKMQSHQPDTAAQGVSFNVADNGGGKVRTIILQAGPSHFGINLRGDKKVSAPIVIADPLNACSDEFKGKPLKGAIAIMERGDCMFVEKARRVQRAGAVGAIIIDNTPGSSAKNSPMFSMSGDGSDDIHIPTVFLFTQEARKLLQVLFRDPSLTVTISELAEGSEVWPPSEEESMFQKLKVSVQEFLNKHTGISFSQRISVGNFVAVLEADRVKLTLEKSDPDGSTVNSYVELTPNPVWSGVRRDIIKGILSKSEWYLPIKLVRTYYKGMHTEKPETDQSVGIMTQLEWFLTELNIEYNKKEDDLVQQSTAEGVTLLTDISKLSEDDIIYEPIANEKNTQLTLDALNNLLQVVNNLNVIDKLIKHTDDLIIKDSREKNENEGVIITAEQLEHISEAKSSPTTKKKNDEL